MAKIGEVEPGRLVYFHNHGDPGPGLYFPERWTHNRAHFGARGSTVPADFDPRALRALPREGFYRVAAGFHCCAKKCRRFEPESLVQLGYNGAGKPLLFTPELVSGAITVPETGALVDDDVLVKITALAIGERKDTRDDLSLPRGIVVH